MGHIQANAPMTGPLVAVISRDELARRYADASALGAELELAGPVGERNLYALHPRGSVLLVPETRGGLIEQMAAVLATGNRGVVQGMALPEGLPESVARRFAAGGEGFSVALVPKANMPKKPIEGLTLWPIERIDEAIARVRELD